MKRVIILFSLLVTLILTAQAQTQTIKVGNTQRTMIPYVPKNLPANRPLIISCHGANQDAAYQKEHCVYESIADTALFAVVFPNGVNRYWDISGNSDLNFIEAIIDTMHNRYGIDKNRVYLSGFSMGGMFTVHAMNHIADKIAAFAPMSGSGSGTNASRPVPLIYIHGTADDVVGNGGAYGFAEGWARFDGCVSTPEVIHPYPKNKPNSFSTMYRWTGGKAGTEVVYIKNEGKGHWVSNDSNGAMSSVEIWNFCKRFSLDPGIPSASITVSSASGEFTSLDTLTVTVEATDIDGTIEKIQLYIDNRLVETYTESPQSYVWIRPSAGNHSLRVVATDNDKKQKDVTKTVTILAPTPAAILSASPENQSFDLPNNFSPFKYVFDFPIDCEKAKATLADNNLSVALQLQETGMSNTLTFQLPAETTMPDGDYTLSISDVIDERGVTAGPFRFRYSFGVSEVGGEAVLDTLIRANSWDAAQSTIGEGIPEGWKRVNSNSDGSNDTKEGGSANTGAVRLKYFEAGGDFNTGFYISAREYQRSDLYYGLYNNYPLHLKPGKYTFNIRSIYWNSGAQNNHMTFSVLIDSKDGKNHVLSQTGLNSTGVLDESTNQQVKGSLAHEFYFNVDVEADYVLNINTSGNGWDGLIIGGVQIVSTPSAAQIYKGGFQQALAAAQALYDATSTDIDSIYESAEKLRSQLKETIDEYAHFASTSPSEYAAATDVLLKAVIPLTTRKTNLENYFTAYYEGMRIVDEYADIEGITNKYAYKRLDTYVHSLYTPAKVVESDAKLVTAYEKIQQYIDQIMPVITGIPSIAAQRQTDTVFYSIDGTRLTRPTKGISIINGKKVFIK